MLKIALLSFFTFLPVLSLGKVFVGTGMSKATQGRIIPSLYTGLDRGKDVISFTSLGVKTDIYYHNAYYLSWAQQEAWSGVIPFNHRAGFGFGLYYSKRAYRNDIGENEQIKEDLIWGPSFRFAADFTERFFLSIETFYGVSNLLPIFLTFHNTNTLNIGVRF